MTDPEPLLGHLVRVTTPSHGSGTYWAGRLIGWYDQPAIILATPDGTITLPRHFDVEEIAAGDPAASRLGDLLTSPADEQPAPLTGWKVTCTAGGKTFTEQVSAPASEVAAWVAGLTVGGGSGVPELVSVTPRSEDRPAR